MIDLTGIDQLASGSYRFRLQHNHEILQGTAPTPELAAQLRDEMKRQILDGELLPTKGASASSLGPAFLASRRGNRDVDNDESRWHRHVATAPWARRPIKAVTRQDGTAWLKLLKRKPTEPPPNTDPKRRGGRRAEKLSVSTRRHCVVLARRFFDWIIDQESYGLTLNPFAGLTVEREDGDEDEGYQETWYLDQADQKRLLGLYDDKALGFDETDRLERLIVQFAIGTGIREGELSCLHLVDVHVDEVEPHIVVRYGSWDPKKQRFRPPKGRRGERKPRVVPLFGIGLEAARAWLASLPLYATKNPLGLMFPTERGFRRDKPPRSWPKIAEAFGVVHRIGEKPWWHLLRHTLASSLVSGWWGMRWALEDVQKVLGHTDVRTTQIYAHLAPSAVTNTAIRAHAAYLATNCHAAVTVRRGKGERMPPKSATSLGRARMDSNQRHSASKPWSFSKNPDEIAWRDSAVTAIRHVLREIADERLPATREEVSALEVALDFALAIYATQEEEAHA